MLTIALVTVVSVSLFVAIEWFNDERQSILEFFVGVELGYGNVSDGKALIAKVKNYTNLFVIAPSVITKNETMLNEVCDYAYDAGLSFLVYFTRIHAQGAQAGFYYHPSVWIMKAREKYGDRFLGVYYFDEPGGNQLDAGSFRMVEEAENYMESAETYVEKVYDEIEYYLNSSARVFTADYGLYWFDYKARYDTVLAEFGWNHSRQLHVALCRGAAKVQNKDWGVIVTWTYWHPPYIESEDELYEDLVLAYRAGAKYVVIFDYPKISEYGILTDKHFEALEKFWNYINNNPRKHGTLKGEVAYVLPQDYGFGFRSSSDTVWGLWNADDLSEKIWGDVNNLLDRYGSRLDVVYSDPEFNNVIKSCYNKLILWNETAT